MKDNPINILICLAVDFVAAKFPKEFKDAKFCRTVYDLVEMVGEELATKNFEILSRDYFNQFVDIKDISYGDKKIFFVEEEPND